VTSRRHQPLTGSTRGYDLAPWIRATCPICQAAPGSRCMSIRSWVADPEHPAGGFFTRRQPRAHAERKPVAAEPPEMSARGELRRKINSLIMRKLSGSIRMHVRRWANDVNRTEEELAAKVAELEAMGDLAW
jgi:hypothetical protein